MKNKTTLFSVINSSMGNVLEWYDFGLFAIYSPILSKLFFPHTDAYAAMMATFSVFAAGFLCRPIGSLFFGYRGDKYGRVKTLRLSILMIALPTLAIGCLPTYEQVGLLAPILLTLTRMCQGISIGGEHSGNLIYLAETAPPSRRATFTAFAGTGANLGILLATLTGSLCLSIFPHNDALNWRLPFLLSGLLCLWVAVTRLKMEETPIFMHLKENALLVSNPIKTAFKDNLPDMLRIFGLGFMGSTFYYFCFIYLPLFLSLHYSTLHISEMMTGCFMAMLFLVPFAGWLCDRWGQKKILLGTVSLVILCVIPGYLLIQTHYLNYLPLVLAVFTIVSSMEQASTSITVVESYPIQARYTGLSFSYNLVGGILGGTVPFICAWLNKIYGPLAPAFYIILCAAITGIVVFFFIKNKNKCTLQNN